ncbi:Sister chromatid cohesion protein PDS5 [Phytophthora nicotianae]|uniref:Sister chromatid cohesion protein PDS5 n=1 Tax=Phytophthora nicotianae TaxID=4792 RepID=A0A0W8D5G3_PHYNI|nr:Sister chromatid cohesion protein PDS5 [Phytophthora nicotianae]
MVDKSELVAYEREKRLYKDAYVENFRSHRLGAGAAGPGRRLHAAERRAIQARRCREPPHPARLGLSFLKFRIRVHLTIARFTDVCFVHAWVHLQLEEIFDTTLPLTTFRSAIMCKHSKARQERRAAEAASGAGSASKADLVTAACRYKGYSKTPGVFKPTSVAEAKSAIQRKVTYDGQPFQDKPRSMRSVRRRNCDVTPRTLRGTDAPPPWATNNPTNARKEICGRTYFNVPPEGSIKADRKYTQEFIRLSMEAYHAGRRHVATDDKRDSR